MCAVECLCAHSSLPMQVLTLHHTRPKSPALAVPPRPLPGVRPLQLCTRRDCAAAHHSRADRPGRPSVHTQRGKPAVAKAPRGPERLGRQPQQAGCPYFTIHLHISCLPHFLACSMLPWPEWLPNHPPMAPMPCPLLSLLPAGARGCVHPPQRAERGAGHSGGAPPGRRGWQGALFWLPRMGPGEGKQSTAGAASAARCACLAARTPW